MLDKMIRFAQDLIGEAIYLILSPVMLLAYIILGV